MTEDYRGDQPDQPSKGADWRVAIHTFEPGIRQIKKPYSDWIRSEFADANITDGFTIEQFLKWYVPIADSCPDPYVKEQLVRLAFEVTNGLTLMDRKFIAEEKFMAINMRRRAALPVRAATRALSAIVTSRVGEMVTEIDYKEDKIQTTKIKEEEIPTVVERLLAGLGLPPRERLVQLDDTNLHPHLVFSDVILGYLDNGLNLDPKDAAKRFADTVNM